MEAILNTIFIFRMIAVMLILAGCLFIMLRVLLLYIKELNKTLRETKQGSKL